MAGAGGSNFWLSEELMGGVLDELRLHEDYAASLAVDLENFRPHPATRAYTDFLLRTAWTAEVGEIMAAMTPCMRLYAYLGQELALAGNSQNPYSGVDRDLLQRKVRGPCGRARVAARRVGRGYTRGFSGLPLRDALRARLLFRVPRRGAVGGWTSRPPWIVFVNSASRTR